MWEKFLLCCEGNVMWKLILAHLICAVIFNTLFLMSIHYKFNGNYILVSAFIVYIFWSLLFFREMSNNFQKRYFIKLGAFFVALLLMLPLHYFFSFSLIQILMIAIGTWRAVLYSYMCYPAISYHDVFLSWFLITYGVYNLGAM